MTREEAKKHYSISTGNEWDFEKFIDKIYDDFEKGIVADMDAIGTVENDFLLNGFDVSIPYLEAQPRQRYRIIIKEIDNE